MGLIYNICLVCDIHLYMKKGILFTGGLQPDFKTALEYIIPCDFICGADSGITVADGNGFIPDILVGDMDSISDKSLLGKYSSEKIRIYPRDKDFTDTELGIMEVEKAGCDYVVLVGGGGGRADHFFYLYESFSGNYHPDLWICSQNLIFFLEEKEDFTVFLPENFLPVNFQVSVFYAGKNTGGRAPLCYGENLKWPLDNLDWSRGASISNRPDREFFSLCPQRGNFILVLPLVKGIKYRSSRF